MPTSDPTPGWGPPVQVRICDLTGDHEVQFASDFEPTGDGWLPAVTLRIALADAPNIVQRIRVTARLPEPPEALRVEIDPNVRVRGGLTYSGFECCNRPPIQGEDAEVYESGSGLLGTAVVTEVDNDKRLVYLDVDWRTPGDVLADGRVVRRVCVDRGTDGAGCTVAAVLLFFADGTTSSHPLDARVPLAPKDQP